MKMKRLFLRILAVATLLSATACFGVKDEDFKELSPITFNEVSGVIDVNIGTELVYTDLKVTSSLPVTYEWSYGQRKQNGSLEDMVNITTISDKADIRYTFNRVGTYVLRLKVDNGEDIVFKYFSLNVNSGMDEGLMILCDDDDKGSLAFIKKMPETAGEDEQEIYPDVFSLLNPDQELVKPTDIFISAYTKSGVQYRSLLISTADEEGSIFKLEPKTFEYYNKVSMQDNGGTYCKGFSGESASSAAYYTLMAGADGRTFRYDLYGDFVAERADASATAKIDRSGRLLYRTSATGKANLKNVLYNEEMMIQPDNAKVTTLGFSGYKIVNFSPIALKNLVYVLLKKDDAEDTYRIQSTTGSLGKAKDVVNDFVVEGGVRMDRNSVMVTSVNAPNYVYYSYDNAIYRWTPTSMPPTAPKITLPEGERIVSMCTNFMGSFQGEEGTYETLLYVATWNPDRAGDKKGSVYVFQFSDDSLVKKYEGVCGKPVKVLYKYRIS